MAHTFQRRDPVTRLERFEEYMVTWRKGKVEFYQDYVSVTFDCQNVARLNVLPAQPSSTIPQQRQPSTLLHGPITAESNFPKHLQPDRHVPLLDHISWKAFSRLRIRNHPFYLDPLCHLQTPSAELQTSPMASNRPQRHSHLHHEARRTIESPRLVLGTLARARRRIATSIRYLHTLLFVFRPDAHTRRRGYGR